MSTSAALYEGARAHGMGRLGDYAELSKPKIIALELVAVTVAAVVSSSGSPSPWVVLNALVGTALVGASASAWNQWLERDTDARMERTAERPLPAGRLAAREAAWFGSVAGLVGWAWLACAVNLVAAGLGLVTWVLYVWVYTPLKSRTWLNTVVGAVAGALPVWIGWAAAGGRFGLAAAALFLVVFLWQFPHFMAIAWLYRQQYAAAGMQMLTVVDPSGSRAGAQAFLAALVLLPVSLLPAGMGLAGPAYLVWALALGLGQLACAARFLGRQDDTSARLLLRASLVYLPALLVGLMLGPLV